jgi:hypothetical protein
MKEIDKLLGEILIIKKSLLAMENNRLSLCGWFIKNNVSHYFNYCDNQLRNLERTNSIEVSKLVAINFIL